MQSLIIFQLKCVKYSVLNGRRVWRWVRLANKERKDPKIQLPSLRKQVYPHLPRDDITSYQYINNYKQWKQHLSVSNKTKKHLIQHPTLFPWILQDQSLRVMMHADNRLGFVLLNGRNQEVPRGNELVSRPKHLTQVSPNWIKPTVPIDGVSLRCYPPPTVISERNKGMISVRKQRRTEKTCSQL